MVSIKKPEAPEILTKQGEAHTEELCKQFDKADTSERTEAKFFSFKSSIYAHEKVRTALATAQNNKCAYCETSIEVGHVEHFRPKTAWRQGRKDILHYSGYYWLAYDWNNLFLSCARCNQKKGNLFPLMDTTKRAISHEDDILKESHLLIHPEYDVPEKLIGFRITETEVMAFAMKNNEKAATTIEVFGINSRIKLRENRLKRSRIVSRLITSRKLLRQITSPDASVLEEIEKLSAEIERLSKDEYSSMIQTLLKEFEE